MSSGIFSFKLFLFVVLVGREPNRRGKADCGELCEAAELASVVFSELPDMSSRDFEENSD